VVVVELWEGYQIPVVDMVVPLLDLEQVEIAEITA
jgi:hypothetical protein